MLSGLAQLLSMGTLWMQEPLYMSILTSYRNALSYFWQTNLEISGLQPLGGFIMEWFCVWDESDAHAASSMISPLAQRLAHKALQSIDNLAT
jgi:hypothetical protein